MSSGQQPSYQPAYPMVYAVKPPTHGMAVVALVFGIAGVVLAWVPWLGLLLGIVGVVCGHVAVHQITKSPTPKSGKGMAIAGFITGYVALAFGLLWVGFFALFTSVYTTAVVNS